MTERERVVETLLERIDALDLPGILALFDPQAVYRDVPVEPEGTQGLDGIRFKLEVCFRDLQRMEMQVASIADAGGRVYSERVETWHFRHGERVRLPVLCVVEFDDDNRIAHWREYWDSNTLYSQLPPYYIEYLQSLGAPSS